jgi:hypothetical protein
MSKTGNASLTGWFSNSRREWIEFVIAAVLLFLLLMWLPYLILG